MITVRPRRGDGVKELGVRGSGFGVTDTARAPSSFRRCRCSEPRTPNTELLNAVAVLWYVHPTELADREEQKSEDDHAAGDDHCPQIEQLQLQVCEAALVHAVHQRDRPVPHAEY